MAYSTIDTTFVVRMNCSNLVLRFSCLTKWIRICCPRKYRMQITMNVNIPMPEEFSPPVNTESRIIELSISMASTIT